MCRSLHGMLPPAIQTRESMDKMIVLGTLQSPPACPNVLYSPAGVNRKVGLIPRLISARCDHGAILWDVKGKYQAGFGKTCGL